MQRFNLKLSILIPLILTSSLFAQRPQTTVRAPFITAQDRFFESTNTRLSVNGPGFFARFGATNAGSPPFGGFNPNAGINSGFSTSNGPWSANFNFGLAQGSSRTLTSTTPGLTLTNGQPGVFINGVQRPFVTGLFPVVNNNTFLPALPPMTPLRQAAFRGELPNLNPRLPVQPTLTRPVTPREQQQNSLIDPLPPTRAEIKARRDEARATRQASVLKYWQKGQAAEGKGKNKVAKLYYKMALRRADGEMKVQIQEQLQHLREETSQSIQANVLEL